MTKPILKNVARTREETMKNRSLFLAIDQGSQSSKAMIFDHLGIPLANAYKAIATSRPGKDRVEHDPEEVLASVRQSINEAMGVLGSRCSDLVAAGLATQRSSLVCWDKASGRALSPVISWQDRRAAEMLDSVSAHFREIHRLTGLFPSSHYGASKMRWCLTNLPPVQHALKQGTLAMGPLASFLAFRLLSERPFLADPANASRTLLFNLSQLNWDAGLLSLFGIPDQILPQCVSTDYCFGHLKLSGRMVPLRIMNGDLPSALFSTGRPQPDAACIQLGTGAFIQLPTGADPLFSERFASGIVLHRNGESTYVLEGTVNGAGSAFEWAERELNLKDIRQRLPEWLDQADHVPLFLNGVSGLGSPFWLPRFESRFVGTSESWQKAVAVIESIVFLLYTNLEGMSESAPFFRDIQVSGGVSRLDGLCQRLADLCNLPVYRSSYAEATARGTAWLLAGMPDAWPEQGETRRFPPRANPGLHQRYRCWRRLMP